MKHTIKNEGPRDIKATDRAGVVWTIAPNESAIVDVVKIWHGNGPANYKIEPADSDAAETFCR